MIGQHVPFTNKPLSQRANHGTESGMGQTNQIISFDANEKQNTYLSLASASGKLQIINYRFGCLVCLLRGQRFDPPKKHLKPLVCFQSSDLMERIKADIRHADPQCPAVTLGCKSSLKRPRVRFNAYNDSSF
ncbi:hypothetical protein Baya_14669 [Bagarius yarrelli]|uniref:Uncharacterized protein n=1 Tax=Bagarius yarrelli TaxID=175774 RepID=A0A556V9Q5_BAGYA|nr:hypothetical protein Baya_14669 [Bagarius yarrelli]